jgi:hypothetical protein
MCLNPSRGTLLSLVGGEGIGALIAPYLTPATFQNNSCARTCYQNFQNASHDFYASCRPQINATKTPLAATMAIFQEFRNQACGALRLFSY